MNTFKSYCEDTSLHGWQYIPRKEEKQCYLGFQKIYWIIVLVISLSAAAFFLVINALDFSNKSVITSLESTTESLDGVFFPAVTICNLNQVQVSFLNSIGLSGEENRSLRILLLRYMTYGKEEVSEDEQQQIEDLLQSEALQLSFCETFNKNKPPFIPDGYMEDGKCVAAEGVGPETYLGLMASQSDAGYSVLSAEFNSTIKLSLQTSIGSDVGMCYTLISSIDFNPSLSGHSSQYWSKVLPGTTSGKANGVQILMDTETYDHGDDFNPGTGTLFLVHNHRDYPVMKFGALSTSPGSIIDISVNPVITTTTQDALDKYSAVRRKCYIDSEVEFKYLPSAMGYRYSFTNCMFDSAYKEVIKKCDCGTRNHRRVVLDNVLFGNGKDIKHDTICKGKQLDCAIKIFDKISEKKHIVDDNDGQKKECLPACNDQINYISYSKSDYPASEVFKNYADFCLLMVKLFDQCSDQYKMDLLNYNYPHICPGINAFMAEFLRMKQEIEASIEDSSRRKRQASDGKDGKDGKTDKKPVDRNSWVSQFCNAEKTLWLTLLAGYPEAINFTADMNRYGKENMLRANIYIQNPFTTSYKRDVDTTLISFIANVGGLMGLCMGFSLVSIFEVLYFIITGLINGLFMRRRDKDTDLPQKWTTDQ